MSKLSKNPQDNLFRHGTRTKCLASRIKQATTGIKSSDYKRQPTHCKHVVCCHDRPRGKARNENCDLQVYSQRFSDNTKLDTKSNDQLYTCVGSGCFSPSGCKWVMVELFGARWKNAIVSSLGKGVVWYKVASHTIRLRLTIRLMANSSLHTSSVGRIRVNFLGFDRVT